MGKPHKLTHTCECWRACLEYANIYKFAFNLALKPKKKLYMPDIQNIIKNAKQNEEFFCPPSFLYAE